MRCTRYLLGAVAVLGLLSLLVGCGDGSQSRALSGPTAVTVTPSAAPVALGTTQQFTASVTGLDDTAVTWSVPDGESGGTISESGLYTAPSTPGTYIVVATSVADKTKRARATVTVGALGISIDPPTATVNLQGVQQFHATVTGTLHTDVTWSVQDGDGVSSPDYGLISATGRYTAPNHEGKYRLVATSVLDPTVTAESRLAVRDLNVAPQAAFTASATDGTVLTNFACDATACQDADSYDSPSALEVSWDWGDGATANYSCTKVASHQYSAPGAYTVTMTVKDTHGVTDSATKDIVVHPAVVLGDYSPAMNVNASQIFTATVAPATLSQTVFWTADGGTINPITGSYTAPAIPGTCHITAIPMEDPTAAVTIPVTVQALDVEIIID